MRRTLLLCCLPLLLACAPKRNAVVLMPDREGHVGKVEVSTAGGTVVLSRAQDATVLPGRGAAPSNPEMMPLAGIQRTFGPALAAEPPAPLVCILHFGTGSSDLAPDSAGEIDRILREIRLRDSRDISINGHTDTTGEAAFNMRLSMARAQRVQELLIQGGVRPDYLETAYHGKGNPLVPTGDNVDEPRNRRVEVIIR